MPSACGVSWDGTSGGKLDRSGIPDPPDHKSHFLNAAETKGDSSFPVVDGSGNLRAGNVNSAWDLRNQGEGVSEDCLKQLDGAFEERVLPDSAYENSMTVTLDGSESVDFGVNVEFADAKLEGIGDGFNKHGVRENDDGSVDVRFNAMEPGIRKGYEITSEFLRRTASKDYSRLPVQLDHSKSQRANVGYIDPQFVKFAGGWLRLQLHVPNTGSSIRDDIIADFTHEPPAIEDISVSFDPSTVEVEVAENSDEPRFVDGRLKEVSLTPFPAGYENGGLTPAFSEAIDEAIENVEFDDKDDEDSGCGCSAESQLITRQYNIK